MCCRRSSSDPTCLPPLPLPLPAAHRWRKRGLAVVPTKFGISFTTKFLNQAGALVHIYTGEGCYLPNQRVLCCVDSLGRSAWRGYKELFRRF